MNKLERLPSLTAAGRPVEDDIGLTREGHGLAGFRASYQEVLATPASRTGQLSRR
jgi:hypothetical protein